MYVATSASSSSSSSASSTTSSVNASTLPNIAKRGNASRITVRNNAENAAKSAQTTQSRRHSTSSNNPPNLQTLVRSKCWSIAPLWKFVTYELEHQPQPATKPNLPNLPNFAKSSAKLSRSASVRRSSNKHKSISYENDLHAHDLIMATYSSTGKRGPIWSKPHPQQSLKSAVAENYGVPQRQPLQNANNRVVQHHEPQCKVHGYVPTPAQPQNFGMNQGLKFGFGSNESTQAKFGISTINTETSSSNDEWKPLGVLKKPGSYRSHAGLKKVAFLENTELNRSTL